MVDRDNEAEEYQDLIPEHLRYIDEKEALEHKNKSHNFEDSDLLSPTFDAEFLNSIETSCQAANLTNFPPTFSRSRFTCKIPEHFMCEICGNVVKEPLECTYCENLMCKECIESLNKCPFGCEGFKFKSIAKFAANMYFALTLECKNKPFGCPFAGTIKNISAHEESCEFIVTQCENSLCDRYILKKDKSKDPGPLLCSEICENLIRFSVLIDENNIIETLQNFTTLSERCKKLAEFEVKSDMQGMYKRIKETKRDAEDYKRTKDTLEADIKSWLGAHHPGKWNLRTHKWTCCGAHDLVVIGCKHTA